MLDNVPWLPGVKVVGAVFLSDERVRSWVANVEGTALLSAQVLVQQQDSFVGLNSVSQ